MSRIYPDERVSSHVRAAEADVVGVKRTKTRHAVIVPGEANLM